MAELTIDDIRHMDAGDPLAARRRDFALPEGVVYLDGNSLGAMPRAAERRMDSLLRHEWGHHLIRAWNDCGWDGLIFRLESAEVSRRWLGRKAMKSLPQTRRR